MIELRPTRLLAGGTLALIAFHLWTSARVADPTVVFDENGYLGNARWLAGGALWEMPFSPSYSAGYSLLVAPVMAVTSDPDVQWIGIRATNALLLASVLPLLYLVLSRVLAFTPGRALAGAFVGAVIPAVVAAGPSAIAENLVLPLVPLTVLAMWWSLDESRRLAGRALLGPVVALLYATHPRFSLTVIIVAAWLAWAAIRRRLPRAVALANGAGLVAVVVAATALDRAITSARWNEVEHLEGDLGAWRDLVTSGRGLRELALTATGQLWYLAVGSFGLALVGLGLILAMARTGGPADPSRAGSDRSPVLAATLAIAASVFATSVVFFAQNQFRPDHFVYGRHNDSFSTLWIGAGIGVILDRSHRRRALALLGTAGAAIAACGAIVSNARDAPIVPPAFSPFAVPAITRLLGTERDVPFLRATLIGLLGWALLCAVVLALALVRRPLAARAGRSVLTVALAGAFIHLGLGTVDGTADFHEIIYDNWNPVPVLERIGLDEVCIDGSAGRGSVNLLYGWALPEVTIRSYRSDVGEEPACTFTVAAADDPTRATAGDRIALVDEGGVLAIRDLLRGVALWVAPGPEADRLDALGALLPDGFPTSLPVEARDVELRTDSDLSRPIRVAAGGRVDLSVSVTHAGRGSPWPDTDSYGLDGRVELLARLRPLEGSRPAITIPAGRLTDWMWPGDTRTVPAALFAVDSSLAPLAAGDYDVTLGIGQVGDSWFESGDAPIVLRLSVTG